MPLTISQIADLVGGTILGDDSLIITEAAPILSARTGEITLAESPNLAEELATCNASAALIGPDFQPENITTITVENPRQAFEKIVTYFRPQSQKTNSGISPQAMVCPSASIGEGSTIYAGASLGENVRIGKGSVIHSGVRISDNCQIGDEVTIFANAVLYENTYIGDRAILHSGVVLGAYGFGYNSSANGHELSAQLGYVHIEGEVEIGACTTIDRGTYSATRIGRGTKIDNQVMIGHNCQLGKHNLICSQVGIAGSCKTGDFVVMAGQVGIKDHTTIGDRVIIGAKAGVMHDLTEEGQYLGAPAQPVRDQMAIFAALRKLPEMKKQLRNLTKLSQAISPNSKVG
ncbi:MAG: UDP-3-O-(3-hydroxymyristoyl)glucosamine N-acyltransferase [Pirellulaceae bacterium]|nr:UDP-3-O-(3-hydroxymyristoyl)glucosamine N-acyltransferase [Pirellulaceae bacterium]